jgi:Flp pilus assembly protein TadD
VSVRTLHPLSTLPRITFMAAALLFVFNVGALAQGIGAHRTGPAGDSGGTRSIQGRVVSPTGRLPETRIRVALDGTNSGTRWATVGDDGVFIFNGLEPGNYELTIDAGKEFEMVREPLFLSGSTQTANVPIYLRLRPEVNPALAGVPKPAVELYVRAQEAARKGDAAQAVSLLNEAVTQHPQFGLAHDELGMLHLKAGALDRAAEEMKLALKALPDDPQVQFNYGLVALDRKDYAEAEKQFRRSLKLFDKSAQAHMYLGVALLRSKAADAGAQQQRMAEAEKELQQSARLGGDSAARAHYYLGGLYWARREYKKAADSLEMYLKLAPKAPDAEQVRGTIKDLRSKS